MSGIQFGHRYQDIISVENLLEAWREFVRGKRGRADVQLFERELMQNILSLHDDLVMKRYRHSSYEAFRVSDPKPRDIHKAKVRDRLLHHALYRQLYPFFDRTFIADSFSCRAGKGTHRALDRFRVFACCASLNHTRTAWVLKCDVRKFFASIDHAVLMEVVRSYIPDNDVVRLLVCVVESFSSTWPGVGLPLGNLTSQLLVNVYMNEFDRFVKHGIGAKYYVRYADDFVLFSHDRTWLEWQRVYIEAFLQDRLRLKLHPDKVSISTVASGVDFLGWVHFPDHRVLRTATRRRLVKAMRGTPDSCVVASYSGLLGYGNTRKLMTMIEQKSGSPPQ